NFRLCMATSGLMKHPISVSIKPAAAQIDNPVGATRMSIRWLDEKDVPSRTSDIFPGESGDAGRFRPGQCVPDTRKASLPVESRKNGPSL
ncbi:hypothetical protein, partial [Nitrobacter sp. 62-13]|uniref:hypothetical protein n=1 Tax=Nitrobacter sp. 62-13 TaxID=1895797 RepID=UPI0026000D3D